LIRSFGNDHLFRLVLLYYYNIRPHYSSIDEESGWFQSSIKQFEE